MSDKYKLTDETINWMGRELHRIVALKDFGDVLEGAKGGFVESVANLDRSGNAWVSGNARVSGDAWVSGNARVSGNAWVYGDAICIKQPIVITGLDYLVVFTDNRIIAGCKVYSPDEWRGFTEKQVREMDGQQAVDFYPMLIRLIDSFDYHFEQEPVKAAG